MKNTKIIWELTTTSTHLANKKIVYQTNRISTTLNNEENKSKGFLFDVLFYVLLGILVVILISYSTFALFIYLHRKR